MLSEYPKSHYSFGNSFLFSLGTDYPSHIFQSIGTINDDGHMGFRDEFFIILFYLLDVLFLIHSSRQYCLI